MLAYGNPLACNPVLCDEMRLCQRARALLVEVLRTFCSCPLLHKCCRAESSHRPSSHWADSRGFRRRSSARARNLRFSSRRVNLFTAAPTRGGRPPSRASLRMRDDGPTRAAVYPTCSWPRPPGINRAAHRVVEPKQRASRVVVLAARAARVARCGRLLFACRSPTPRRVLAPRRRPGSQTAVSARG